MAENQFGADPQSLADAVAKMEELSEAQAELDAKVETFKGTEADATSAIRDNVDALSRAVEASRSATSTIESLTRLLAAERSALTENTAAWEARARAMQTAGAASRGAVAPAPAASTPRSVTPAAAEDVAAAGAARAPRRSTPVRAPEPVVQPAPAPQERYRGQPGAWRDQPTAYVGQPGSWREPERGAPGEYRRRMEFSDIAARPRTYDPTMGPVGSLPTAAPQLAAGRQQLALPAAGQTTRTPMDDRQAQSAEAMRQEAAAARENESALQSLYQARAEAMEGAAKAAATEQELTQAYHQSVAAYAESSSALSRNGALTTEFIQAFARGDVTLKQFSSDMTSTIGKFAGWAAAGAAVYGAYDAIKKLGEGAKETQEGIVQVSRFIPGAGSGRGEQQVGEQFRSIASDLNVPISEVTSSMAVMARSFHNVSDAADATRAVLLATRLDQISPEVAQQSFVGIAQSYGMSGHQLLGGVIDPLNSLQNITGARVSQLLPAISRAAPAAAVGGISLPQLMGLADVGVRAGLPGGQVGTSLLRSISTMAWQPSSEAMFRRYGINPVQGQYGNLWDQITKEMRPGGSINNRNDVNNIAVALGGRQLGSRTFTAIVARAQAAQQAGEIAQHPPQTAQQELNIVLGGVGEQAKKLGVDLENLGSELEQAGLLEPIQIALRAVGVFGEGLQHLISPLTTVVGAIDRLGPAVRDTVGVFAGVTALGALRGSRAGFVAQGLLGRVPGLGALKDDSRNEVVAARARYRTYLMPDLQRNYENASRRRVSAVSQAEFATSQVGSLQEQRAGLLSAGDTEGANALAGKLKEALDAEERALVRAETAAQDQAQAMEELARITGLVNVLANDDLTYRTRAAYLAQQQVVLQEQLNSTLQGEVERQTEAQTAAARAAGALQQRGGRSAVTVAAAGGPSAGEGNAGEGVLPVSGGPPSDTSVETYRSMTPAQQMAAAAANAEADQPDIQETAMQNIAAQMETPTAAISAAAPPPQAGSEEAGVAEATTAAGRGLLGRAAGAAGGAAQSVLGNPMALLGATMATSFIPGAAGQAINNIVSPLGIGAFLSQTGVLSRTVSGVSSLGAAAIRKLPFGSDTVMGANAEDLKALDSPVLGAGLMLGQSSASHAGTLGMVGSMAGSALAAGQLGAMIGSAIGPEGTAAGALIGGGIGAVSGAIGGYFENKAESGGGTKKLTPLTQARNRYLQALTANQGLLGSRGPASRQEQLASFGTQFSGTLESAFNNGNVNQAQQEQQQVETFVRQQSQLLGDTGVTTGIGRSAAGYLAEGIGSAATSEGMLKNPDLVGQIIDSSQQALMTADSGQQQYQLARATSPAAMAASVRQEQARMNAQRRQAMQPVRQDQATAAGYRRDISQERTQVTGERGQVSALKTVAGVERATGGDTSGTEDQIQQLDKAIQQGQSAMKENQSLLTNVDAKLKNARDVFKGLNVKQIEQVQSDASNALQSMDQAYSDVASVATARAGGDRMKQLQATITESGQQFRAAKTMPGLAPGARQSAERQATAQRLTAQTGEVTEQAARLQASQSAGLASIDQSVHPEQYAQRAADNARAYYEYVMSHKNAFDATDIKSALQNMNQANVQVADATYSYQSSVISAMEQLQEAKHPDDAVAAGRAQAASGQQMMRIARTRPERLAAQTQSLTGQNAAAEAMRSNADTTYQIAQTEQQGNSVGQALTQVAQARHDLATALGPDEVRQAREALATANVSLAEARRSSADATYQITEAEESQQPIKLALTQIAQARHDLATALGPDEAKQAKQSLATANSQLHQAQQDQITATGELAASQTNNQLQQDTDQLNAAQKKLTQAIREHLGKNVIQSDTTARNQAVLQKFNDNVSQQMSNIDYLQSTMQISAQQALADYEKLLDNGKKLSQSQKQQIQTAIYGIETNQDNSSAFDLTPAGTGVRAPTIYDARTAAARERQRLRDQGRAGRGSDALVTSGKVDIGGALLNTHGGALTTYDTQVEKAVRELTAVMKSGGAGGAAVGAINVYVGKGEASKVADVIDRTLGSRVRARMRSAGVRGT